MTIQSQSLARTKLVAAAAAAFTVHGFDRLTMGKIAALCGVTRRALYHHFSSKEELFRAAIKHGNVVALEQGAAAARRLMDSGAAPLDVLTEWFDVRFGQVRRRINESSHGAALNEAAFRLATDIMIEVSYDSNRFVAELLAELQQGKRLALRKGMTAERAARLLVDGARGVNQARPPVPSSEIAQRYRDMTEAVLYGCAAPPEA